jgi:dephospho-CoA kinase
MQSINWDQIFTFSTDTAILPRHYESLTSLPIMIIVGLTGVGKTTALTQLAHYGAGFTLLPNRRKITDEVIIGSLQREAGLPPAPVTDRVARFEYTARYRAKYPGGMAFALSRLAINSAKVTQPLIFDGLRGLEEVQQAAYLFPLSRFVVLDAPDAMRLTRLLNRGDAFDSAAVAVNQDHQDFASALAAIANIETVFNQSQLEQIARFAQTAQLTVEEVAKKVAIIVEERRNYDSNMARIYLSHTMPPNRVLVIDTAYHWANAVARRMAHWLTT